MNINFSERKWLLQKARRNEDFFEWEKYLQNAYPSWWESKYSSKWPVRIIYYNIDNTPIEFCFHINRYETMEIIMNRFYLLLRAQISAIRSCFGQDIAMIICKYMPLIFNPKNNYLYYHSRPLDINNPNGHKFNKVLLNPITTLNKLSCATRNDYIKASCSRYTNLRMRAIPNKKPSYNL